MALWVPHSVKYWSWLLKSISKSHTMKVRVSKNLLIKCVLDPKRLCGVDESGSVRSQHSYWAWTSDQCTTNYLLSPSNLNVYKQVLVANDRPVDSQLAKQTAFYQNQPFFLWAPVNNRLAVPRLPSESPKIQPISTKRTSKFSSLLIPFAKSVSFLVK